MDYFLAVMFAAVLVAGGCALERRVVLSCEGKCSLDVDAKEDVSDVFNPDKGTMKPVDTHRLSDDRVSVEPSASKPSVGSRLPAASGK